MKIVKTKQLKTVIYTVVKNPCMLHGCVFEMEHISYKHYFMHILTQTLVVIQKDLVHFIF